jgi:hypothetical protein
MEQVTEQAVEQTMPQPEFKLEDLILHHNQLVELPNTKFIPAEMDTFFFYEMTTLMQLLTGVGGLTENEEMNDVDKVEAIRNVYQSLDKVEAFKFFSSFISANLNKLNADNILEKITIKDAIDLEQRLAAKRKANGIN